MPTKALSQRSCVRHIGHLRCEETRQACFCTAECAAAAESASGGPSLALRRVLARVPWDKLSLDERNNVRFMLHVLSLRRDSSSSPEAKHKWEKFCDLHALPPESCSHERVWEVIKTLVDPDVSHDDVSLCLRKEAANGFGIMAPLGDNVCPLTYSSGISANAFVPCLFTALFVFPFSFCCNTGLCLMCTCIRHRL